MENGAKQATRKRLNTRGQLWPEAGDLVFDPSNRATKGYAQVPRVVPIVARLINEIGGAEKAGPLYQVLWAQDWGQGIVEVKSFRSLLYEAGYQGKGPRVERTWEERINILRNLGFIKTAARGLEKHGFILMLDPHLAVLKLNAAELSANQRTALDGWMVQFRIVCEQWGVDLAAYQERISGASQEVAS